MKPTAVPTKSTNGLTTLVANGATSAMAPDEPLLTPADVAKRLAVSLNWVYERIADGTLPSVKLGKYRRVVPSELRAWLAQQREGER